MRTSVALPLGVFFAVTAEMAPAGSVEHIAAAFGTDLGSAASGSGLYALSTAVLALPLAAFAQRFDLRKATILAGLLFAAVGLATSAAPGLTTYLVLRAIHGAVHGVFFSLVLALAAVSTSGDTAKTMAKVLLGNGFALALGVPLSEALGAFSWRLPIAIASCGVLIAVLSAPRPLPLDRTAAAPETRSPAFGVAVVAVVFALALAGHFSYYTFLAPTAASEGVPPSAVLGAYGAAVIAATAVSGSLAGRRRLQRAAMVVIAEGLVLMTSVVLHGPVAIVVAAVLAGACFGMLPTLVQTEMLHRAKGRQTVAAGAAVVAFNAGIAAGSTSGAAVVGFWTYAPVIVGAALLSFAAIGFIASRPRTGSPRHAERADQGSPGNFVGSTPR